MSARGHTALVHSAAATPRTVMRSARGTPIPAVPAFNTNTCSHAPWRPRNASTKDRTDARLDVSHSMNRALPTCPVLPGPPSRSDGGCDSSSRLIARAASRPASALRVAIIVVYPLRASARAV